MNNVLHISLLLIGPIFAINAILGGVVQIYGGRLGDLYGFKRIIITFASAYFVTLFLLFYISIAFPIVTTNIESMNCSRLRSNPMEKYPMM